jgi:hypothetical protein
VGALLRGLHAAAATFIPPTGTCWKPWFGRELPGAQPVIGHCDTGPWNIIARSGRPVALVDFEFAGPVDAAWELAQAAWLNAQLHDDDVAERLGLPDLAGRGRQLRLILDGYGLPARERAGFVDKMITFAVHNARAEAVEFGVTPHTTAGSTDSGYPFVWAITWRIRHGRPQDPEDPAAQDIGGPVHAEVHPRDRQATVIGITAVTPLPAGQTT